MTAPAFFLDEAGPADLDDLADLEQRSSAHPWTLRHLQASVDPSRRTRVLAVRALEASTGRPALVAFCACRFVLDELHVENLVVAPEHRRRGLGRLLLRTVLNAGRGQEARVALLEVRAGNTAARRLYESEGFRETGQRRGYYTDPVEDAHLLSRAL